MKALGQGLWEMRIHAGPGYRVYLARRPGGEVVLLTGGDKGSQGRDINRAREILAAIERAESDGTGAV